MHLSHPAPAPPRRRAATALAGLLAAVAALAAAVGAHPPAAATGTDRGRPDAAPAGPADGTLPDGATPFDDALPGIAGLDPDLRAALRAAATAAARDGVRLEITSGRRSRAHQERLLREAVDEHGSLAEAARWVAPPDRSAHVSGDAADVGPPAAAAWLAAHGAAYGLCRTYANEPWHVELHPDAPAAGCPAPYADASRDPRLR